MSSGATARPVGRRRTLQRGLHTQLVNDLGQQIVGGDLLPGDTLPTEDDMCAHFGVSKTVVREAVRMLAAKGLVQSRPRLGTRVLPRENWSALDSDVLWWQHSAGPTDEFLKNLEECRSIVEPAAARLAALRATEEELLRLEAAYERMAASIEDSDAFFDADVAFHETLIGLSHNGLLEDMSRAISTALHLRHDFVATLGSEINWTLPEHQRVVKAIVGRRPNAAYSAMVTLLARAAEDDQLVGRPATDG